MPNRPIPDGALELERRKRLTARVRLWAYYTDGRRLAEVVKVYELGHIILRDVRVTDTWEGDPFVCFISVGIDGFRRDWWLVREAGRNEAA